MSFRPGYAKARQHRAEIGWWNWYYKRNRIDRSKKGLLIPRDYRMISHRRAL